MTGLGPFDLHGPEFLTLYCELALIALFAAFVIPHYLRPDGQCGRRPDEAEIALLAGGRDRFAETVTVGLLAKGAANVQSSGKVAIRDPRGGDTMAERRVAALTSPASWQDIHRALAGPAETAERQLEAKGLWMDRSAARELRLIQTAPLALFFLFGMAKWIVGTLRDRPVGILTALLIVTAIAAILRFAVLDRRTRAGMAALADARLQAARLRRAAPSDEAPLAVALFGTAVLAGSFLSDFHRMRSAGSGDSGGGCGGGGCGGCGS